jgi:NodT family efflux transporter outer membrane factor (OMF) lipoprotein
MLCKGRRFGAFTILMAIEAAVLVLAGCSVGPKYQRASVPTPSAYKEPTAQNVYEPEPWKVAQPSETVISEKWWEIFGDSDLSALEEQVDVSNQNVAAAASGFLMSRALVREARSGYYPSVTTNPSIVESRPSPAQFGAFGSGAAIRPFTTYSLPFDASWQPDFWGRVSNSVASNTFAAQASAADLQAVRLTAQAEIAVDYFELRAQDALKQLFDATVAAYQDSLDLTQIQFRAGIASDEAVAQAETQLRATEAQDTNLGISRMQFEHAIGVLVGQPPSSFSLTVRPLNANPPAIPYAVPAELLERRPDIAQEERRMAAANAQIGLARAAFYPNVTLSAAAGLSATTITSWFTWPSRFWSIGPSLAQSLFDAGLRRAAVQQSQALYLQTIANYRQTTLVAFQQVEDNLAALRILSTQIQQQDAAIESAQRNLQVTNDRYRAGIDPYLNVIAAQASLLNNQEAAVNLRREQMVASVQLVEALGGGWNAAQLPTAGQISATPLVVPEPK